MDITITHKIPIVYNSLLKEINKLKSKCEELELSRKRIEIKYGYEVILNNRLIDILKSHGIPWK